MYKSLIYIKNKEIYNVWLTNKVRSKEILNTDVNFLHIVIFGGDICLYDQWLDNPCYFSYRPVFCSEQYLATFPSPKKLENRLKL